VYTKDPARVGLTQKEVHLQKKDMQLHVCVYGCVCMCVCAGALKAAVYDYVCTNKLTDLQIHCKTLAFWSLHQYVSCIYNSTHTCMQVASYLAGIQRLINCLVDPDRGTRRCVCVCACVCVGLVLSAAIEPFKMMV